MAKINIELSKAKSDQIYQIVNSNKLGVYDSAGSSLWEHVKKCILQGYKEPTPMDVFLIGFELGKSEQKRIGEPTWKKNW